MGCDIAMSTGKNRNDTCPCGSGKKFKKCCGLVATASTTVKTVEITPLVRHAYQAYSSGDLMLCSQLCHRITAHKASNFDAIHLLGLCQLQSNNIDSAISLLEKAVRLEPKNALAKNNLAYAYYHQGRYHESERLARIATHHNPALSDAHNNLGQALLAMGKTDAAITAYLQAVKLDNLNSLYHYNLGTALHKNKRDYTSAQEHYAKSLDINPNFAPALANFGTLMLDTQNWERAKFLLEQAQKQNPTDPQILTNLGLANQWLESFDQAIHLYRQAIQIANYPAAFANLGVLLETQGRVQEAIDAYQAACREHPNVVQLKSNLIKLLFKTKKFDLAYQLILDTPDLSALRLDVGLMIVQIFQKMCDHKNLAKEWEVLKTLFTEAGADKNPRQSSNKMFEMLEALLLCINYDNSFQEHEIFAYHKLWAELANCNLKNPLPTRIVNTAPGKKLRVGYISPDFRSHPVGFFIKSIICNHNKTNFEIYCYSLTTTEDEITRLIREHSDKFISVALLNDQELSEVIYNHDLDVLIHLAGHTEGGRLQVLATRPAPVQISYLGYPNTTGAEFIDYWITDPYAHNTSDNFHTERLLQLSESFLCFGQFEELAINPITPAVSTGYITFGSFNNLAKISPTTIRLWSKLLANTVNSRLVIKHPDAHSPDAQRNILEAFSINGITNERVIFPSSHASRTAHLEFYNTIDIALDPVPYNGTTTTCEALWMGVPVLTVVGQAHRQRVSYSILKNIGVDETIAFTEDDFVKIGIRLSNDLDKLTELRKRVASGIRTSILCDPEKFTRQYESALLHIGRA